MKTHAKLVTADKTTHTEFHKSKFCPVRNRPKLWNSKTSQNCHFTPISAWQLFHHSFRISPRSYRRLPSLALPPGLEPLQKPIHWEQGFSLLRRSCERPRQTCIISCHSGQTPKPSSCLANDIRWVYTSEGPPPRLFGDSQWRSVRPQQGHNPWHRTHPWDLPVSNHWSTAHAQRQQSGLFVVQTFWNIRQADLLAIVQVL